MDFPLIVFTDLDGTLLDHDSYSYEDAVTALQHLRQHAIPLILTSSKTRVELRGLQEKLRLNEPFIAENGGGVFIPAGYTLLDTQTLEKHRDYYIKQFGRPYQYIREVFATLRSKYNIKGFGDMTIEEIMAVTNLDREDVVLAAQRDFTEPFLLSSGLHLKELEKDAAAHGLKITRGGRFYHLMAAEQDKGRAVLETLALFQAGRSGKIVSVGLGDAENDFPMLKKVDTPVLIPKPDGSYENLNLSGLRKAPYPGSKGWGAAVMAILDDYRLK
jgi:mannosyl-3-phosphoglycerate phosphatase